jgi:hypothetical protein
VYTSTWFQVIKMSSSILATIGSTAGAKNKRQQPQ